MRRRRFLFLSAAGILVVLAGLVVAGSTVDGLGYRMTIVRQKATGGLPDVSWGDLLYMLDPRTGFWLEPLVADPNPYVGITRVKAGEGEVGVQRGREIFVATCAGCHGHDAGGGTGPALVGGGLTRGDSDWALYRTIRQGVPGTAMAAQPLGRSETWQVVDHLRAIARTRDDDGESDQNVTGIRAPYPPVTFERLKLADGAAGENGWLTYSGSYNGQRYTPLAQIDRGNVAKLRVSWIRPIAEMGADMRGVTDYP
jgi:alcohol dehydrogenase (cytochrome c)